MLFKLAASAFSLVLLLSGLASAAGNGSTESTFQLYAYGKGIGGYPVYYRGGTAYIGIAPKSMSNAANVTFSRGSGNTPSGWTAAPSNGSSNIGTPSFYVQTNGGPSGAVGFANSSNTPSGAATTGFTLFGEQVIYSSGTSVQAAFWAEPVSNATKQWVLVWNSNNTKTDTAVPVTLKTIAPSKTEPPSKKKRSLVWVG
jgi:hypothetical protein